MQEKKNPQKPVKIRVIRVPTYANLK